MGLKAVDVRTEEVSDERADVMSGEEPVVMEPGGRRPKPEKTPGLSPAGGAGPGPAARGVRSSAPREFDSEAAGLSGCCDEGGLGT
jgi:hypothetical protein